MSGDESITMGIGCGDAFDDERKPNRRWKMVGRVGSEGPFDFFAVGNP